MGLKYKIKKLRVRVKSSKQKDLDLNDVQDKAIDIVLQMINSKDSELVTDPDNSRKGIKNKGIFININRNKISILNGVYHYDVPIDDRVNDYIVDKFNSKLTRKFNTLENQARSKIKNSMDDIKDGLKNKL